MENHQLTVFCAHLRRGSSCTAAQLSSIRRVQHHDSALHATGLCSAPEARAALSRPSHGRVLAGLGQSQNDQAQHLFWRSVTGRKQGSVSLWRCGHKAGLQITTRDDMGQGSI